MHSTLNLLPGDILDAQLRKYFSGSLLGTMLQLADELQQYNEEYDENFTLREYIQAFYPNIIKKLE